MKWIKVKDRLPEVEGQFKVKRRYTLCTIETAHFTGKEFTNQHGYAVVEWLEEQCEHDEIMRQGDGFVYGVCGKCGAELY